MESRVCVSVDIEGMEQIEKLLEEHEKITTALEKNVNSMRRVLREINLKINQPSAGTDS